MAYFLRQSSKIAIGGLLLALISLSLHPQFVQASPNQRPLWNFPPAISLNVPPAEFIGNNVAFTVTFDNIDTVEGYGPLIDLIIPTNGADGAQNTDPPLDGLTFVSATYLGVNVEKTVLTFPGSGGVTCVNHPYMVNNTGNPIQVCGNAGDTFVALRLPFGSFTPQQPPLVVNVTVSMSNLADLGVPLTIQARGGYQFGYTPLDDWCCGDDPSLSLSGWQSDSVTPILFTLSKSYSGPENETATGPNFPRHYTVTAQIAPGQTMTSFTLTDVLPNNMQFVSVVSTNPIGATCSTPSTTTPGGTLSCTFTSVTGTASMTFEYYIPLRDAGGASVIDPASGDDATSCNNASGGGTWTPIDTRDSGGTFIQDPADCEHILTDKSIAIQKSVSVVGGGIPKSGATLEYALDFQISDFFAFNSVVVTDTISDGQHFYASFTPTLQINGNFYTLGAAAFNPANYDVTCNYTGGPGSECTADNPAVNDGTTMLTFRVSNEIISRGQDGRLIGGCVPTGGTGSSDPNCSSYNDGPTTGRIVFRTVIQQNFTDTYPSGDPSVDQGDTLNNTVNIAGDLLSTSDASTPTGYAEADGSTASVSIGRGALTKSVYAVNGSPPSSSPVEVKPGDEVTFRLTYTLPTGDVEDLEFDDYLPLPVFHVGDPDENGAPGPTWTFTSTVSAAAPPAGVAKFGPTDTFYAYSSIVPTILTNTVNNRLNFFYGDFDGTNEQPYTIDILFTVTVSDDPFADRLYLTNQAHAYEGSTNSGQADANAIVQIILTEPVLTTTKSVVASDNLAALFTPALPISFTSPGSSGPRWSGTISSNTLPIDSDISGVDAGDLVTFAIFIENTGSSINGAFDIVIQDVFDAAFEYPTPGDPTSINLQIYYGNGTGPISYTKPDDTVATPADLFVGGIKLVDPVGQGVCQAHDPNSGNNVIVILYDLRLKSNIAPGTYANTGLLTNYSGSEGGPNFLLQPLEDDADVTTDEPALAKTLVDTEFNTPQNSNTQVVIGEWITYTVAITVPEGVTLNAQLVDTLDAGLAFGSLAATTLSPGVSITGIITPSVSSSGQIVTFNLGDIINSNTDNSVAETITLTYRVVVLNILGNQANVNLNNSAQLSWTGGSASASASEVTVIEPVVNTSKTAYPTGADAGDTVTFTVTLTNPASGSTTAYDVTWSDVIPNGLNYVSASGVCGATPLSFSYDSLSRTLSLASPISQLNPGESCTITINVTVDISVSPGQLITNTTQTRWTSLPGTVTDRSPYNNASDERTGEDGLPGPGVLNDYRTQGQATVTITFTPTKSIVSTSEAHTGLVGGYERLVVGEIVRYRLVVAWPEGTALNAMFRDNLPAGLQFLDLDPPDDSKVAFVCNSGPACMNSSTLGSGPVINGNETNIGSITPTYVLTDTAVSASASTDDDTYGSGTDPFFKFGDLANNDNDADQEFVVVEFNALVLNISGNQSGTYRENSFTVRINDQDRTPFSNSVRIYIAEPTLTLNKSILSPAPTDAGDTFTYRLVITNTSSSNNAATAFDLVLTDTFDSYLTGITVPSITTTQPASCIGETAFSTSSTVIGQTLTVNASCLDPSRSITVEISVTVASNAPAGYILPNTANLTYTSLPGPGTSSNPTGGITPGGSGAENGERNGQDGVGGALNDYAARATVNRTLAAPQIVKGAPTPTSYTVGATVTFPITITLPEGVTHNVRVTDAVTDGLQYVSYSLDTTTFNGTVPTPTVTGGASNGDDVTFTFGDITTTDDNNPANNSFILYVTLRVLNVSTNYDGVILPNSASLTYWPGTGTTDSTIPGGTQNITVIEPQITTTKSVSPTGGVQAGDIVTYTVRFTNTGNSTAYDVTAQDTLAQGAAYNASSAACLFLNGSTSTPIDVTVTVGAGMLTFDGNPPGSWDIPATNPDTYIECTYTVTAQSSLYLDGAHTNTIDADWSSLNDSDPHERLYDDSGTSPLDGTQDTASAIFNSPAPTFDKSDNATNLPIGATYTVTLTLTSPLGTLRNLTITDTLPVGLFYLTGSQNMSAGISPTPTFTLSGPNDGSGSTTLTWAFGDAVVSSSPITFTYQVVVANVSGNQNGTLRTNTATLSYTDAGGTPRSQTDTDTITVIEPELNFAKSVDNTTPIYGQTLTYTLTVSHLSTSTATAYDIVVTDTIPSGLTYVSGSISAPAGWTTNDTAAPTLTWTCSAPCSLPVGNTAALTYQVTVASAPPPNVGDTLTNTASLTWTSADGANPHERTGSGGINDYSDTATQDIFLTNPDLTITKTDGQLSYIPGSPITYTIVVRNIGNGDALGATISDTLPTQITSWAWACTGSSGGATGCDNYGPGNNNFSDTVDLPAGSVITYTVTAQVSSAATGDLTNKVEVIPPTGITDPTPTDNSASDTDTPNPQADLSVSKDDGVTLYVPGSPLVYTVVVRNAGPSDAPGAVISDTLPAQFTSWTWACTGSSGGATGCDDYGPGNANFTDTVSLPAASVITYTVTAQVSSSATNVLTNTVTVSPPTTVTDPNPDNNTDSDTDTQNSQAAISVSKDDGTSEYTPGSPLVYTIVVKNLGPSDALAVQITDTLPAQITSWSWSCTGSAGGASGCTPYSGSETFTDTLDLAGPFPSVITYTVTAQVSPAASDVLTNTITVSHPADTDPADNSASDTDTPNYQANLYVTKDDSSATYTPGVGVTYTVTISNYGPSDVTGAVLTDTIPAQATSWTWTCSGSTGGASGCDGYGPGNAIFSDTVNLPANSAITYTVSVDIPSSATGDLVNTATLTSPDGVTDPDPSDNSDTDTDTPNPQAAISVSKDDGVTEYVPGSTLTYTITVTNTGPSDALGVSVVDNIPTQFAAWEWTCVGSMGGADGCTPYSGSGNFTDSIDLAGPFPSSITYRVVAQVRSSATGNLTNSVTVSHPADTDSTDNSASDTDTPNPEVNLLITKEDGLTVIAPGSVITYTVVVNNAGPSDVVGAIISDTKPAQIVLWSWACVTSGGATCTPQANLSGDFNDTVNLPVGSVITYTITASVDANAVSGTLVNRVTVNPPEGVTETDPSDNEDDDQDVIITEPQGDLVKAIFATNQDFTPLPNVAIGEVITYEVRLRVPALSVLSDLVLTDVLDPGLAFMGCDAIITSSAAITTTLQGGFEAACNDPNNPTVQAEPPGSTAAADLGRRITFSLGEVQNQSEEDGFIRLRYGVVVLNSPANHNDVSLENNITLTWSGGSLTTKAPEVVVVEPDFILEKKVDRNVALPGSILTFTITFRHSPQSRVDAFNVVLRDTLPPELTYVPGSLMILSGPQAGMIDDQAAPKLKVSWDVFPLLTDGKPTEAVIQFQAQLGQLPAGQKTTNTASLEWSTLPTDVPNPQSPYNPVSTERYYGPDSGVDIFTPESSVEIDVPLLPLTGFPPARQTPIPLQPNDKVYTDLASLWLEIPKLGIKAPIVGIPIKGEEWDLTWLWDQVGWLDGTAYPTHRGNSALTAHVYLPSGLPGPFASLAELRYGDQLIIHLGNQQYLYEVREVKQVLPNVLSALRHEQYPWLTLITCSQYDERSQQYRYRIVVRAVLIKIKD